MGTRRSLFSRAGLSSRPGRGLEEGEHRTGRVGTAAEAGERRRVAGPEGGTWGGHGATESEPSRRLIVLVGGCSVETGVT